MRVQLIDFVVAFPHAQQRLRADNQRAGALDAFEMLDNRRADIAFPKADNIRNKAAIVARNCLNRLAHRHTLEIGQPRGNIIVPQKGFLLGFFKPITHQHVQRFHVDIVGRGWCNRPRLLKLGHQRRIEVIAFGP